MGGGGSSESTELVRWDGKISTTSFSLKYSLREACGIPDRDTDTIIVTGGVWSETETRVSQYDKKGNMKNLPSLNTGRGGHGCAQFTDNGVKVVVMVLDRLSPRLRS